MQNFLSRLLAMYSFVFINDVLSLNAALNIEIFGGATDSDCNRSIFCRIKTSSERNRGSGEDLERTGLFRMIDSLGHTPHEPEEIIYADWQNRARARW